MKPKYIKVPKTNTTPARKLKGGEGPLKMNISPGKDTPSRVDIMRAKNRAYNRGNDSA